jgi:hypothetical protein
VGFHLERWKLFFAFPSETHPLAWSSYNNRQPIEACIHSALPHGRWQLRCGGHHRCSGAVLGGNTTVPDDTVTTVRRMLTYSS